MAEEIEEEPGSALALHYINECVPVGKQKTLGYFLFGLAAIHKAFMEDEPDKAKLLVLLMLMAGDQYALDENWTTAWKLTGMRHPPWSTWSAQDLATMRRQHQASALADRSWVAAMIGAIKDEDVLVKRRGKGKGRGAGDKQTDE